MNYQLNEVALPQREATRTLNRPLPTPEGAC